MTNLDLLPFADALRDAHPLWEGYTRKEKRLEAARALRERFGGDVPPMYLLERLIKMVETPWTPHQINPDTPHIMERIHTVSRMLNQELGDLLGVHFTAVAHYRTGRRRFLPSEAQRAALVHTLRVQRDGLELLIEELDGS